MHRSNMQANPTEATEHRGGKGQKKVTQKSWMALVPEAVLTCLLEKQDRDGHLTKQ